MYRFVDNQVDINQFKFQIYNSWHINCCCNYLRRKPMKNIKKVPVLVAFALCVASVVTVLALSDQDSTEENADCSIISCLL